MTFNTSKLANISARDISETFRKTYPELSGGAVITKIEISGCQGSRRTGKIDLSYEGDDITNQKSVSKSEVRWIDVKALSFKSTITSRITTLCSRLCIRYSNMWILPVTSMQEFIEEAQEIEREFQAGIQNVLDNYDDYIQAEKNRSPVMAELIDQLKLTKDDFKKSFRFNLAHFIPFTPISVEGEETDGVYQEQLLVDLADEAAKVYAKISQRDNMRSSTIARLKQMQNKIISFMFIHKEAAVLADAIKHIVNNLPSGAINEPRDVAVLQQWFFFMSDASMLKRIISGEQKVTDWLDSITKSFNLPSSQDIDQSSQDEEDDLFASASVFGKPSVIDEQATGNEVVEEVIEVEEQSTATVADTAEDEGLSLSGW
ncbi:DUF3150 domain-containing protein [Salmonella enterica]|nr:DUF3150 domain-containing protein [Salmonella enterica]EEX1007048.1 DUF3150 domain-containing protein [Escherichia coli]